VSRFVLELRPPESRHYASWDARIAAVTRYSRPDEVHALCEQAYALGARVVFAVLDDTIREALRSFQQWRTDVELWVAVPNMFAFIRDLTDLGMVGAARARFTRLTPAAMVRTGLRATGQLNGIRKKDFATGAMLVADMELAALRELRVRRLFLHQQVTEIALAGGVTSIFAAVLGRAAGLGIDAGLVTHNPVRARAVLGPTLERFTAIIAPANPRGYKMVPDRAACEALYRAHPGRFFASEATAAGSLPLDAVEAYASQLGLGGAVLDATAVALAFRGRATRPVAAAAR
jgi:hypothetical protein